VPETALVFGAAARLSNVKRIDVVIRSIARLEQLHPDRDIRLVLAGDGPERAALTSLSAQLLRRPAMFVGHIDRPWEFLSGLDVFTLSSLEEGLPFALIEAMACERSVIATAVGGVPEVLEDPACGWLVPAGDQDAFDRAAEQALSASDHDRRRMGRLARQRVVERYNSTRQLTLLADSVAQDPTPDPVVRRRSSVATS